MTTIPSTLMDEYTGTSNDPKRPKLHRPTVRDLVAYLTVRFSPDMPVVIEDLDGSRMIDILHVFQEDGMVILAGEPVTMPDVEPDVDTSVDLSSLERVLQDREKYGPLSGKDGSLLRAIAKLWSDGEDATGLMIHDAFAADTGANLSLGSLYTTLDYLQKRGYLTSRPGRATPERGNRRTMIFSPTPMTQSYLMRGMAGK